MHRWPSGLSVVANLGVGEDAIASLALTVPGTAPPVVKPNSTPRGTGVGGRARARVGWNPPEVDEGDAARSGEQDVLGLDIAMGDAGTVELGKGARKLLGDDLNRVLGESTGGLLEQPGVELAARRALHDHGEPVALVDRVQATALVDVDLGQAGGAIRS